MLNAQNLTVDQIMPLDLSASSSPVTSTEPIDTIPVVLPSTAMQEAEVRPGSVIETIHVAASRLQDNRSRPSANRAHWQRFLAIRADPQQTAAMDPILAAGATVVLDRHYCSLAPDRAHQPTLYAVRYGTSLVLRYVEFDDRRLILRPLSPAFPVQLIALGQHETPADYIIGRVCLVISEL